VVIGSLKVATTSIYKKKIFLTVPCLEEGVNR